ncbi:MAG: lipoyl synthase [Halanaerobiaceae bacterium]
MRKRLPQWLQNKHKKTQNIIDTQKLLQSVELDTVCRQARCPNRDECYGTGTATFLILGSRCTRSCAFCAVEHGEPRGLDEEEPQKLARAVRELELEHVVITSVTRDDLPLGGARQFANCLKVLSGLERNITTEVLTPDFQFKKEALRLVVSQKPDIYNHNIETVPRLYSRVRPEADYERSLAVLEYIKEINQKQKTKSGLMVGLGEEQAEVIAVMEDLREIDCDFLTIGQYLQPTNEHLPVEKFVKPEMFDRYEQWGKELGFEYIKAGPLVRSSYQAEEMAKI